MLNVASLLIGCLLRGFSWVQPRTLQVKIRSLRGRVEVVASEGTAVQLGPPNGGCSSSNMDDATRSHVHCMAAMRGYLATLHRVFLNITVPSRLGNTTKQSGPTPCDYRFFMCPPYRCPMKTMTDVNFIRASIILLYDNFEGRSYIAL